MINLYTSAIRIGERVYPSQGVLRLSAQPPTRLPDVDGCPAETPPHFVGPENWEELQRTLSIADACTIVVTMPVGQHIQTHFTHWHGLRVVSPVTDPDRCSREADGTLVTCGWVVYL